MNLMCRYVAMFIFNFIHYKQILLLYFESRRDLIFIENDHDENQVP